MKNWIPTAAIYQVNLRSIASREPRNPLEAGADDAPPASSPLAYLADHLDMIRDLGIRAIHLMPIFLMGVNGRKGIGSPYAIRDFSRIDPEYGTRDDLAALVNKAHDMDLKVLLGMVPNHTSRDHVWARSHPEFYVKTDDGTLAHDLDWTDTAKLDYRQAALRDAMLDVYNEWLGFLGGEPGEEDGVDGFRIDMAHFINDLDFWNETVTRLRDRHARRDLLFLAECYGMDNNLDLFTRGFDAAYDDTFYKCALYFYGIDEHGKSIVLPDENGLDNDDFRDVYKAFTKSGVAGAYAKVLQSYEDAFAGGDAHYLARYTDNHDEGRGVFRFGDGATRAVNLLACLAPHSLPFLLAGQEFGALNRPPIHERIQACEKGRRRRRNGSIEFESGVEFEGNLFARGAEHRASWRRFYRELLALRSAHPALSLGSLEWLDVGEQCKAHEQAIVAFKRRHKDEVLSCAVNMGDEDRTLADRSSFRGPVLYGALDGERLPAFSAIVTHP